MKNLVTKMKKMSLVAVCLTLVLGVMGICGVTAKANAPLIMQTIYTEGTQATMVVKVAPEYLQQYGVTLVCKNPTTGAAREFVIPRQNNPYQSSSIDFGGGNSASWYYDSGENYSVVTFKIQKNAIPAGARAYFYCKNGETVIAKADNGGYGYYLFE